MLTTTTNKTVIHSLFSKYDANSSNEINATELGLLCEDLGYRFSASELDSALLLLDKSGNGTISFDEFYEWWCTNDRFSKLEAAQMSTMTAAVEMFRKYDTSGSRTITFEEFESLAKDMGWNVDKEQTLRYFDALDTNDDMIISFNEFIAWLGWFKFNN